ncbi:MAG: molecular chaperone TorD family protein [Dehalobacterium sp.]
MAGQKAIDKEQWAERAKARAQIYHMLAGFFGHVPDGGLIDGIKSSCFQGLLESCIGSRGIFFNMEPGEEKEILEKISVDRTRIVRVPGNMALKPPYEGLYKRDESFGIVVLNVKRIYRDAGLMPESTVHESPDFLGIELDFMRKMCLREQAQWCIGETPLDTIGIQEKFLKEHLNSWVKDYCRQAEKQASTNLCRSFISFLDRVIASDMKYVQKLGRLFARD